ncbi:MAG TPA: CocE/NonD family hydrolase [Urbifossiella sp.]|nr:CocE/NonD family hydrolase [Urbifossiella sp.]
MVRVALGFVALLSIAADFKAIDPNVFPKDDPRAKALPKMLGADLRKRMREANLNESEAFAKVTSRQLWEGHRQQRIRNLRDSLGEFPTVPAKMRIVVTRKLKGEGYLIHNLVYESRPGFWVSANLYLPANRSDKMPGFLISHAHHTPKGHGELQDMGMTWARAGCAVLVPDHLGHGERRQHDFATEKDYPRPFRPSRQDYYFRYNTNLQLSAVGESLMGWMAWDLMRGVEVLLKQEGIDKSRIILLGAVAGGGDPAGVTAALDNRIACVVPFNFSGWQPESNAPPDPDRNFDWFGDGYWESTRGLRGGAAGGFAHFIITGSIAPRKLIYAHEFKWDPKIDPAWPRLQKIYGFYNAKQNLGFAHGAGSVKNSGPGNTHCTHIGATHRKMIYPYLKEWFGMAIPEEYSKRRKPEELLCWTDEARKELKPKKLHEALQALVKERQAKTPPNAAALKEQWKRLLGPIDLPAKGKLHQGKVEDVPGGKLARFAIEAEAGIVVPFILMTPTKTQDKTPVVVMVAQAGKARFLQDRSEAIAAFLDKGIAVCLVDVRGTGETRGGSSAERGSSRTSISQTEMILGRTVLGNQLRDLRTVIRWLQTRPAFTGCRVAVWGDSFAPVNPPNVKVAVPLDAPDLPAIAEPGGAILAGLASLFEPSVSVVYTNGGFKSRTILDSPDIYVPHEAVVPGVIAAGGYVMGRGAFRSEGNVDSRNRLVDAKTDPRAAAAWVIEKLGGKQ